MTGIWAPNTACSNVRSATTSMSWPRRSARDAPPTAERARLTAEEGIEQVAEPPPNPASAPPPAPPMPASPKRS